MPNYPFEASGGQLAGGIERQPAAAGDPAARDRMLSGAALTRTGLGGLPWILALVVATVVLLQAGTPGPDIGRYAAYWCLGVTLPGLLVARATIGTRGNWPEDLAIGAVTGLGLEAVCFTLWSLLGQQQRLWLWPPLVVGVFVVVPRLHRHWRVSGPQPLSPLWSWGVASAIAVSILTVRQGAFAAPLPPAGGSYDQDLSWHLSIVHELTRSFPPQVPQISGEVLRYHWLSHLHLAAAHLVSGAPEATVVLRLWIIPLLAVTALIGARLARELSGTWWSGPVAAWGLIVFTGTNLLPVTGDASVIVPNSPSQIYVVPLVLGVTILIARAVRGTGLGPGWAILTLLLLVAAGAKPTAMPLVLAGACLAGLWLLLQRRREWRAALSVVATAALILPVSLLALAGSDGGSTIRLFDFVEWDPIYHGLTGAGFHPATGPLLPLGVHDLSTRSMVILTILLTVPVVANISHLVPFGWFGSLGMRGDAAAWFVAGFVIAGWLVYLLLSHPADSQAYFLRLGNAMAVVFGAWALAASVPPAVRSRRRVAAVLAGGSLIGAGLVTLGRTVTPALTGRMTSLSGTLMSFLTPLAVVGAGIVGSVVVWRMARRRISALRGWGSALALAAIVLGAPAQSAVNPAHDPRADFALEAATKEVPIAPHTEGNPISPDAAAAMAWVSQNTANSAVVATNRHCVGGPERPGCESTAFWVSGLGGRQTVLEGWGYAPGAGWPSAPTPFPARLAVNDAVFTDPSASSIDRLRQRYGATWLVADSSAGRVSPKLAQFATVRFSSGQVTVYELR